MSVAAEHRALSRPPLKATLESKTDMSRPTDNHRGRTLPLRSRRAALALLVAGAGVLAVPAAGQAATTSFGSDLSAPASLDTTTAVQPSNHYGADTSIWNMVLGNGSRPVAPAAGQIVQVRLKGCAVQPPGVPAPDTQIHIATLRPQGGGAVKVIYSATDLEGHFFHIPICSGPADVNTVSTYVPQNLCVNAGDYVAFNDEGGFAPNYYVNGVAYRVLSVAGGSTFDSFIRNNGENIGDTFSPSDRTAHDGFGTTHGAELLLQAVLATGPDATPLCPGGTQGARAVRPGAAPVGYIPGASAAPASAGKNARARVNARGVALVSLHCATATRCQGQMSLDRVGAINQHLGVARFSIAGHGSGKVRLRVGRRVFKQIRHQHGQMKVGVLVASSPYGPANTYTGSLLLTARKR